MLGSNEIREINIYKMRKELEARLRLEQFFNNIEQDGISAQEELLNFTEGSME